MAFDPLSSSQITVDPDLHPTSRADGEAVRRVAANLIAAGVPPEQAMTMAYEHVANAKQDVRDQFSGFDKAAKARRAPRPGPLVPPQEEPLDIDATLGRQMTPSGYIKVRQPVEQDVTPMYGRGVPGPRTLDGKPVSPGRTFSTPEEAAEYDDRAMGDGRYMPSQLDQDMAARGMVPVYNPDGSVGYSVAAPESGADSLTDATIRRGAPGRGGRRADLESAGWVAQSADSPLGPQTVYRPGDEARQRYAAQENMRAMRRIAESAGISSKYAANIMATSGLPGLRMQATANRIDDKNARKATWKAQAMLAGANPRKNMVNALGMMSPAEREQSLQYMLPGGQLAAQVDALNAQQAGRMAQSAMTAFLTNNPGSTELQREAMRQQRRQADPAAAGAEDLASGRTTSPQAQAEIDRLATSMDTTYGGFSYEDERALARKLQEPPYNLPQPEAEEAAYRAAEKRRRIWMQGGGPAGSRTSTTPAVPEGAGPPDAVWSF